MWLVQYSGLAPDNTDKVMRVLDAKGIPFRAVGVVPFTTQIMGIDDVDPEEPIMVYGSTKLIRLAGELGLRPGVFFDHSSFNAFAWKYFLPDAMVNSPMFSSISELRRYPWHEDEAMFVRPVMDLKLFSGSVKPAGTTWDAHLTEKLNGDRSHENAIVAVSGMKEIHGEWRCFIVNRKLVTASQYRINGELKPSTDVHEGIEAFVEQVAARWLPHDHCVMDVALVTDGDFKRRSLKVMEFNCINASGLYEADAEKLVDTLNSLMV